MREQSWLILVMLSSKEEHVHLYFLLVSQAQVKTRFISLGFSFPPSKTNNCVSFLLPISLSGIISKPKVWPVVLVPSFHSAPTSNPFLSNIFHFYSLPVSYIFHHLYSCVSLNPHLYSSPTSTTTDAWRIFRRQI